MAITAPCSLPLCAPRRAELSEELAVQRASEVAWLFWKHPATGFTSFEMYGGQLSLYRLRRCSRGRCPRCAAFLGQTCLQCFPWGLRKFQWLHHKVTMQYSRISGAQSCGFNRSLSLERRHSCVQSPQMWISGKSYGIQVQSS